MNTGYTIPRQTSTEAFENYVSSKPILSSIEENWQHLIARIYVEPQTVKNLFVPVVPDSHIVFLLSGSVQMEVKEECGTWKKLLTEPGQLFLTPPNGNPYEMRWVSCSNEPIHDLQLHLNTQFLAKTALEAGEVDPSRIELQNISGVRDPLIEQICRSLFQELQSGTGSKLYAESAAQFLAVHLLRHHCTLEHRVKEYSGGLPKKQLCKVIDYIQTNLDAELSLSELAKQVELSVHHFARLFKQSTGESPNQYVMRLRVEHAKQLLRETSLSILEVTIAVGYNSPSHFVTQFKRITGVTPSTYRNCC